MTLTRKSPMSRQKASLKSGEKKLRARKCSVKGCKEPAVTFTGLKGWCSVEHGAMIAEAALMKQRAKREQEERRAAKDDRKKTREALLELKPLHYWAKRAERACNEYIRFRDAGDPCISCGTYDAPEWHAGHCYTVAARPDIRYNEDNIHLQCPKCNTYNGGMVGEYKRRIVSKIGEARFNALEYVNPAFKKTREYYQGVEAHYKAKLKALKASQKGMD